MKMPGEPKCERLELSVLGPLKDIRLGMHNILKLQRREKKLQNVLRDIGIIPRIE
jgi:hypothetical protein